MALDYALEAREALRLVALFEKQFYDSDLYCGAFIDVDGVWIQWCPRSRQIQYREDLDDQWTHASRVFKMEIPGILLKNIEALYVLLKNIEALYDACLSEQERVANVLSEATDIGGAFADKLASKLNEDNTDARNI